MRYISFIIALIGINAGLFGQVDDFQLRVRTTQNPDSILIMSNDTNSSSATYKTGKWRKASDIIGSVTGDTDWYKLGGTLIPTNSDSAYRTGYTLFDGLSGGLTTKIEMLKEGILQFDNEAGEDSKLWMAVKPLQQTQNNPSFNFDVQTSPTDGTRNNDVMTLGWNMRGALRVKTDQHAMGLSFENNFIQGSDTLVEFHYRLVDKSNVDNRIFSYITKINNEADWYGYNTVSNFWYTSPVYGGQYARFGVNDANTSFLRLYGPSGSDGAEFFVDASANYLSIAPYLMGAGSTLYMNSFDYSVVSALLIEDDLNTPTELVGRDATGWVARMPWTTAADSLKLNGIGGITFYEIGGTSQPNAITDNIYKTSGSVTIGNTAALDGILNVVGRIDQGFPTNALNNIAIGASAGNASLTGDDNIYLGASAGTSNTAGTANVNIGFEAGKLYTGNNSRAIGYQALSTNV